ncbi:Hypothetical predicted protein [Olea europaea subsp. europaea]|uniref:Uncharacterized protein n=1 Tax=Olea europaea subsp. europaea TaxID=158383 RepID=A0A8S0RXW0_OLEEU|nr:Hypothetical predicted protein [Olea europaea subsp. europaea]
MKFFLRNIIYKLFTSTPNFWVLMVTSVLPHPCCMYSLFFLGIYHSLEYENEKNYRFDCFGVLASSWIKARHRWIRRLHAYRALFDFQYIDSKRRDQGSNVRRISQSLVALLMLRNKYKKYMKWLLLTVTSKFASRFLITLLMALFNFQYIGSNMRHKGSMLEGYLKSLVALVND